MNPAVDMFRAGWSWKVDGIHHQIGPYPFHDLAGWRASRRINEDYSEGDGMKEP
jgi:hypothetical protein